jgi:hypothetical protein
MKTFVSFSAHPRAPNAAAQPPHPRAPNAAAQPPHPRDLFFAWLLTILTGMMWVPTTGCDETGCTKAQESEVMASLSPLALCIVQAASRDFVDALSDPISLLGAIDSACASYGKTTAAIVLTVIESWFRSVPKAPIADASASASIAQRLLRVHDTIQLLLVSDASATSG